MSRAPAMPCTLSHNTNAMGYSPFSIESLDKPENNQITRAYDVLRQLTPLILANQGKGAMAAALLDSSHHKTLCTLGDYVFTIRHEYSWAYAEKRPGAIPRFGAMIIKLANDEFIIAGSGVVITFTAAGSRTALAGIGRVDEGKFINDQWIPGRPLERRSNPSGPARSPAGRHVPYL